MSSREDYKWTDEAKNLSEGLPPNHQRPTKSETTKPLNALEEIQNLLDGYRGRLNPTNNPVLEAIQEIDKSINKIISDHAASQASSKEESSDGWIPIGRDKIHAGGEDMLIGFETGAWRRYMEEDLPAEIITHYMIIPRVPAPPKSKE